MTGFVSEKARLRVERRGVTEADIVYCLSNHFETYSDGPNVVYHCRTPQMRLLKVAMRGSLVDGAFFHL